jgi:hypothetical protein
MLVSKAAARILVTKRAFRFLTSHLEGVAKVAFDCAHRTSTFLSCAFCEQGGHLATPSSPFSGSCYSTTTAVPLALTINMVLLVPIVS